MADLFFDSGYSIPEEMTAPKGKGSLYYSTAAWANGRLPPLRRMQFKIARTDTKL